MSDRDPRAKWISEVLGITVGATFQTGAAAQSEDDAEARLPGRGDAPLGEDDAEIDEREDGRGEEWREFETRRAATALFEDIFATQLGDGDTPLLEYWVSRLKDQGVGATRDEMLGMLADSGGVRGRTTDQAADGGTERKAKDLDSPQSGSRKGKEKDTESDLDNKEEAPRPRRPLPPWPSRDSPSSQSGSANSERRDESGSSDKKKRLVRRIELMFDQELGDDELDASRSLMETSFGAAVSEEVFRDINLRRTNGKRVFGRDVQTAGHKAVTMVSPLSDLRIGEEAANTRLALAQKGAVKADRDERDAEEDLADSKRRVELLRSNAAQNATQLENAEGRQKAAFETSRQSREELSVAIEQARQATANRVLYERSLQEPFALGEDAVKLENQCHVAKGRVSGAARTLEAAEKAFKQAEGLHRLADQHARQESSDREDMREALDAGRNLAAAEAAVANARAALQAEESKLAKLQDRLAMLNGGPALRRVQALLDNLGTHPELQRLIEQRKPSTGGNKAQAVGKTVGKLGVGAIPVVGLGVAFGGMIVSEDQERRLTAAASQLADCPMAAVMAEGVARSKEKEKNTKGITGAVGMVLTALTLPVAGGAGVLFGPAAGAAFGSVGGHVAVTAGGKAAGMAMVQGAAALGKKAPPGQPAREGGEAEAADEATWPGLPAGSALPTIRGDGGDSFDLNDPPVALALLEFLGPKRTARGGQLDEERRLRLRQEMFGSGPDMDLVKGKTKMSESDKQIRDELDQGSKRRPKAEQADKLRLLYIALGWLD